MIRPTRRAVLLLSATLLAACDNQGIEVLPEVDRTFGFEEGLEGWVPGSVVPGGTATVQVSSDESAAGVSSVKITIDDASGGGAAWISRLFELEPSRAYDVELIFDLGTSDGPAMMPWSVVAGAGPAAPTAAPAVVASTATDEAGFTFEARTVTLTATTTSEGELFVTVGIAQGGAGTRTYFLDDLQVVLTRR